MLRALVGLLGIAASNQETNEFLTFVFDNNKEYSTDQYRYRYSVFNENKQFIDAYNSKNTNVKLQLGPHADMTFEEYMARFTFEPPMDTFNNGQLQQYYYGSVPDSVDWRDHGVVAPVQDQGQCGSCWSWAVTGSVESLWAIKTGNLTQLSKQQMVDCSKENQGCNGGLIDEALQYIIDNGLESADDYPYVANDGACKYDKSRAFATIDSYNTVLPRDPHNLMLALIDQPIPVTIDAGSRVFQFYKSGIIQPDSCGVDINHATLAVGYGSENGQDYWIVKNSWSDNWGEAGYFRLARASGKSMGTCGIHRLRSYYPVKTTNIY